MSGSRANVIRVWCAAPDQFAHIRPVEAAMGSAASFHYDVDCDPTSWPLGEIDIVLCVNEWPYATARCLEVAKEAGIPTLLLQDGILEWRCQYENPLFGCGSGPAQHQPVIADKIACIGKQTARTLSSWGNGSKVEVTGMPRMDKLLSRPRVVPRNPAGRILVMTAKKPGFTSEQVDSTIRSVRDLQSVIADIPRLEVIWRVAPVVAEALGIENQLNDYSGLELAEVLDRADAVVTTPSTAILESMLLGRPVATLDYHNTPHFVQTAWTISAKEHGPRVVRELLAPSAAKMQFQSQCLHDALSCQEPAAPQVGLLIRRLVEMTRQARKQGDAWRLPANILGTAEAHIPPVPEPLARLYPDRPAFEQTDIQLLHGRLARTERRNRELEAELERRRFRGMLLRAGEVLSDRLRTRN